MTILVLGGTSYFGKRLVNLLLRDGHKVTVATRGNNQPIFDRPVEMVVIDRRDRKSMQDSLGGRKWDVVYDQVCYDGASASNAAELFAGKIAHLVFTSTLSVYDLGCELSENSFCASIYIPNPQNLLTYQEGKRCAERVYALQKNFSVVSIRFPLVMGPDDPTGRLKWHWDRIKTGKPIYAPQWEGRLSYITSEEAAQTLKQLSNTSITGALNVGSEVPLSLKELTAIMEDYSTKTLVVAETADKENHSPYGVAGDCFMSMRKARDAGFAFKNVKDWIPKLVGELT